MNTYNFLLCILVAFLWSLHPICHKILKNKIDVFFIFILIWFFTSIFMILILIYYKDHIYVNLINLTKIELLILTALGLISVLANFIYFYVIKHDNSYIVSAITYCSPLFTIFIAFLILNENFTFNSVIGITLIIVGASILSYE